MATTLHELERNLALAIDAGEKVDLLIAAPEHLFSADPKSGLKVARKGLRLARAGASRGHVARSHLLVGRCHEWLGDHEAALESLNRGLAIARELGDRETEAYALQWIGIVRTDTGEYSGALEMLHESLAIAGSCGDIAREASVHNSIGLVHYGISDFARALEQYQRSLGLFETVGDHDGRVKVINNVGALYLSLKDLDRAHEQFLAGTSLAEENGNEWYRVIGLLNLATVLSRREHFAEARTLALEALEHVRDTGRQTAEIYLLEILAISQENTGDPAGAEDLYRRALDLATSIGDPNRAFLMGSIGSLLMKNGRVDEALPWIHSALDLAVELGHRLLEQEVHENLATYYETSGDPVKALEHHKRFASIQNELAGQEQQRRIAQLQMRSEIEQAEKQREILRLEKLRLEQEVAHKSRELSTLALNLIEKNQFLDSLKREISVIVATADSDAPPGVRKILKQVDGQIGSERDWKVFEAQFEQVHNEFLARLSRMCPALTRSELKVCALLKMNMSNKEIADLLSTSDRTIGNHRYKIRKKLALDESVNLPTWFASL